MKISFKESIVILIVILFTHFTVTYFISNVYLKVLSIVLIYFSIIYFHFRNLKKWIINDSINKKNIYLSIISVLGFYLINFSIPTLFNLFFLQKIKASDYIIETISILTFVKIIIFPFFEEFLFRNTILEGLKNVYGAKKAILLSALFFTLAHIFTGTGLFLAFLGGLFLGYVFYKTRNLYHVFFLHSIINICILFISPKLLSNIAELSLFHSSVFLFFLLILGVFLTFFVLKIKKT